MHALKLLAALVAPFIALAAPTFESGLQSRQGAPKQPEFCKPMSPAPSEAETKARFDKFANAFIVTKNITEAFEYISEGYINNNKTTGAKPAWDFLSRIWGSQNITVLGTTFKSPMGWLHYKSGVGEVVDRYRWEAGCIIQHWDQGEKYPAS